MDRAQLARLLDLVIEMAADYSIETRLRRLIEDHQEAGVRPRCIVMNFDTLRQLLWELDGHRLDAGYWWIPSNHKELTPTSSCSFMRIPILVKDFMPDQEVVIGV